MWFLKMASIFTFSRVAVSRDGPSPMASDVVLEETNAAGNCFGANRKKIMWPHVVDIINNKAHKL